MCQQFGPRPHPSASRARPGPSRAADMPIAMKRPAAAQKTVAKKAKVDPVKQKCNAVAAALEGAPDLPADVLEMLGDMLPGSLGVAIDERHDYQSNVVTMIANALDGIEAGVRKTIATGEEEAAGAEPEKAKRAAVVTEADAARDAKRAEVQQKKEALADDALAFRKEKSALQEAEDAQQLGDVELDAATGKREKLLATLHDAFLPLKEGAEGAVEPTKFLERLRKQIELDQSLVTATASALSKAPGVRGPFDTMAIAELEERISKTIGEFDVLLTTGEPAKKTRAAEVAKAQMAFGAARNHQRLSANAFSEMQAAEKACEDALKAAKKSVQEFNAETRKAATALNSAKTRLEKFLSGPLATFTELRGRVAPPPYEPEQEAVAEAEANTKADVAAVDDSAMGAAEP